MLEVGSVVYIKNTQITPEKNKYMLCVHVKNGLFFCINTENRRLYECLPILKFDNPYLKYDSYIACNRLFHFDETELNSAKIAGSLGYRDLVKLQGHIRQSVKTLSQADKEKILKSLDEALADFI